MFFSHEVGSISRLLVNESLFRVVEIHVCLRHQADGMCPHQPAGPVSGKTLVSVRLTRPLRSGEVSRPIPHPQGTVDRTIGREIMKDFRNGDCGDPDGNCFHLRMA